MSPRIPSTIGETLLHPARRGEGVHEEMRRVIFWMASEGLDENAIWRVVNSEGGYGQDPTIPKGELARLIEGAVGKVSSGYVPPSSTNPDGSPAPARKDKVTPEQIRQWTENAQKFTEDKKAEATIADFLEASPIRFHHEHYQLTLLETLFAENEIVAVQSQHYGAGDEALYVEGWRKKLRLGKRITGKKGAWLRPNPMKLGKPSGKNGTYADQDCSDIRFGFLESDYLPMDLQLAMLASFRLPIVAITDSAGKSYHAIVKLKGNTSEERQSWWIKTLGELSRFFGYDISNKNPSKYTRLAGAFRDEGRRADSNGEQRLIYLAKDRPEGTAIL